MQPKLSHPFYDNVVTENDKEVVYVTDNSTHLLNKFSLKGEVLLTYRDNNLSRPHGLTATGDGHVLVCGRLSHNVQVVSKSGKKVRTLLTEENGIKEPRAICYDALKKKVYISDVDSYQIKSFELQ